MPAADRIQPKPVLPKSRPFWAIGHRGFPTVAPENTLASFRKAVEAGVDMVEFDVMLTKDRIPIVFHDRTLKRTTNGKGSVRRAKWEAIRKLDAGSWFSAEFSRERVPTLSETLDFLKGRLAINIEIKLEAVRPRVKNGIEEKVLEAIHLRGMEEHIVISSFLPLVIRRIKRLAPNQSAALLLSKRPKGDPRKIAERWKADALHLSKQGLDSDFVARSRGEGIPIRVFTVDNVTEMEKLLSWGVDGIFTNYADRLATIAKPN